MSDDVSWMAEIGRLERSLLAAWVSGPFFRSQWTPKASEFSDMRTKALAGACAAVAARGSSVHPGVAVVQELSRTRELVALWEPGATVLPENPSRDPESDLVRWRRIKMQLALRQRLAALSSAMVMGGEMGKTTQSLLEAIRGASAGAPNPLYTLGEGLLSAYQSATTNGTRAYATGFSALDRLTGGARPGHIWSLGAPTNWGKTAGLLAFADNHLLTHSSGVLIVTCEDDPELIFTRWLARRAGVKGTRIRDGRMRPEEVDQASAAVNAAGSDTRPVILDGRKSSVEAIASDIAALVPIHGVRLVLVDYIQAITTERTTQDRRIEINHIARTLMDTIKTSGAAGILASQVTGEDLRESRDVENASEVVLIGRKSEEGMRSFFLKKNKTGPNDCVIDLEWDDYTGSFVTQREENYDSIFGDT